MKANSLSNAFILMSVGLIPLVHLETADTSASTKSTASETVPANPFGPKPLTPTETPTSTSPAVLDTTPLSNEKFVAAVRSMLLQRFDKNKDGALDADEQAEARALFSGGRTGTGGQVVRAARPGLGALGGPLFGLRPLILSNFGKSNDETLSAAEIAKLHTFLFGAEPPAPKPDASAEALRQFLLKQFDKNGDGKLDEAELAAAKTMLQQILADLSKNTADKPASPTRTVTPPARPASSASSATSAK